jgi:hypothetical protein
MIDIAAVAGGQVVQHGHPASVGYQFINQVRTNEPGTTGHQCTADFYHLSQSFH